MLRIMNSSKIKRDKAMQNLVADDHDSAVGENTIDQLLSQKDDLLKELEKKTAEIRQSEQIILGLLDIPHESAMLVNTKGRILAVNTAGAQMLGRGRDVLFQQNLFDFLPEVISDRSREIFSEVVSTGKDVSFMEDQNGSSLVHHVYPVKDDAGIVTQIALYTRDVTERKKAEERLRETQKKLETMNMELITAYSELKSTQSKMLQSEKMASIGQLAAGVAHEINNPVGFVTSNLGTLRKYIDKIMEYHSFVTGSLSEFGATGVLEKIEAERKRYKIDYIMEDMGELIEESLEGTARVKKIVRDLKSFSRVDEDEYKAADINECVESTLNIVWNELKYKVEVHKELGDIPMIRCYPQQINQVFMNLLVNAGQAIENHGEITIKTWCDDTMVRIRIADTGCGIPGDKISRIFEPFFTTKEVGKGTGLGLSIVYDIIKKHHGDIDVRSEEGKGTTFEVSIPAVQENDE